MNPPSVKPYWSNYKKANPSAAAKAVSAEDERNIDLYLSMVEKLYQLQVSLQQKARFISRGATYFGSRFDDVPISEQNRRTIQDYLKEVSEFCFAIESLTPQLIALQANTLRTIALQSCKEEYFKKKKLRLRSYSREGGLISAASRASKAKKQSILADCLTAIMHDDRRSVAQRIAKRHNVSATYVRKIIRDCEEKRN